MIDEFEAPGTDWSWGSSHVRVGVVLDEDPVAFRLLRGEPLVRYAAVALDSAGIAPARAGDILGAEPTGMTVVFLDAACPLLDPDTIELLADRAEATDRIVVGVRPVTDTVKRVGDGRLGETVDRDELQELAAPVVVPATCSDLLAGLDPRIGSIPALVAALGAAPNGSPLHREVVPPEARRLTPERLQLLATGSSPRPRDR